jgi:hypothetical protein
VKTVPGPSLEVIETEFLLQLLMRLLADPARLADLRDNTSSDVKRFCGFLMDQELDDKTLSLV